jgi:hypothetical protein
MSNASDSMRMAINKGLMSSTTVLRDAVDCNHNGIRQLQCRLYGDAIASFSMGLRIVKNNLCLHHQATDNRSTLPHDEEQETSHHDMDFTAETSSSSLRENVKIMGCQHVERLLSDHSACHDHDTLFVFSNPLYFSSFPTSTDWGDIELHERCSFVLLYNLALAHHLSGLEMTTDDSHLQRDRLCKALALYEVVYALPMNDDHDMLMLQSMAVVNNMGHIHNTLGADEIARQCFQHVLSTIVYLNVHRSNAIVSSNTPSSPLSSLQSVNDEINQHLDGFLANVINLILHLHPSAPAA